jgi:hypothetical protein
MIQTTAYSSEVLYMAHGQTHSDGPKKGEKKQLRRHLNSTSTDASVYEDMCQVYGCTKSDPELVSTVEARGTYP